MKKWIIKNYLWLLCLAFTIATIVTYVLIRFQNDSNVFSFWGSFLGGLFGGIATLIAFLVTSKQNRIENKGNRDLQIANIEYAIKKENTNNWYFEIEQTTKEILRDIYPYDICEKLKEAFEESQPNIAKAVVEKVNNVTRKIRIEYSLLFNLNINEKGKGNKSCTKEESPILFSFQQFYDKLDLALQEILGVSTNALAALRVDVFYLEQIDSDYEAYYHNTYQPLLKSAKVFLSEIKELKIDENIKFIESRIK